MNVDFLMQNSGLVILTVAGGGLLAFVGIMSYLSENYNLNRIKSKTTGDGQYGSARWATDKEVSQTYKAISFAPEVWRANTKGQELYKDAKGNPLPQGIIVGLRPNNNPLNTKFGKFATKQVCKAMKKDVPKFYRTALVDTNDVHALMIGAAGIGKTAYWLYPCIEYACASGMSFLTTDTKGDILRNYGHIARDEYGYRISVIDLRNPTRSHGNNILSLVNKYIDLAKKNPDNLAYKSKAEKYAKIISKTVIMAGTEGASFGQNSYFYDSAEGILTASILLVSEFGEEGERHIVSVYKLIQQLMRPSLVKGKNEYQKLVELLPEEHKARWYSASALGSADQAMASVFTTALSRLNSFIDSELEQILCFDTEIDAERFCKEKSALFVIMPEENPNAYFMVSLVIQQMYREILAVADEMGGKLKNRCVFFCDEFGTLPKIESAEMMFSASRSRRLQIVPIIQSFAQLNKNYGKEGAEIIIDNTQLTIFGGFAPSSNTAKELSTSLGSQTVQGGSISRGEKPQQTLHMIQRDLMSPDELKSMPKGQFIIMKTGCHPMKTQLSLYFDWGISFDESNPFIMPDNGNRKVLYVDKDRISEKVRATFKLGESPEPVPEKKPEQETKQKLKTDNPKNAKKKNKKDKRLVPVDVLENTKKSKSSHIYRIGKALVQQTGANG